MIHKENGHRFNLVTAKNINKLKLSPEEIYNQEICKYCKIKLADFLRNKQDCI